LVGIRSADRSRIDNEQTSNHYKGGIFMFVFTLGGIFIIAAISVFFLWEAFRIPKLIKNLVSPICMLIGIGLVVISTAIEVNDGQSGIVTKKFGNNLTGGSIVATNGEKGPQAFLLPDGWHFGYWPWQYELSVVDNIDIPQGSIGVVTAKDGKPLPEGEIFAPEWKSPQDMLDGMKFLSSDNGFKGPQVTVLPPGQYRYNPRLFNIVTKSALEVPVGQVAVIKSNVGETYVAEDGETVDTVNGIPIVPNGFRGIWKTALQPNAYYMHPEAFVVRFVQTTKRVYSYTAKDRTQARSDRPTEDNSVEVKTKDGFKFPVDVRVSVKISAEDAPYVVAMLADPDSDPNGDGFDILEDRAILPSIRSIFRNTAETKGALEYLDSRSTIEKDATSKFAEDMAEFKVDVDRVYIAAIGLDKTDQGAELLKTQTDKELAVQQQATYIQQEAAEIQRASMVKAKEDAEQEKFKAEAAAKVTIAKSDAEAKENLAKGEAAAYAEKIKAFGGVNEYIKALTIEGLVKVIPEVKLPNTVVFGGGNGTNLNETLELPVLTNLLQMQQQMNTGETVSQARTIPTVPQAFRTVKGK
jgi:uncharacterized membrane protein YqiK